MAFHIPFQAAFGHLRICHKILRYFCGIVNKSIKREDAGGAVPLALAIVIGILAGIVGFLPLFASMRLSRKSLSLSTANTALYGLGGVFVSLVVAAAALIICAMVARSQVLPFGLAEMLALIVSTSVYTLYRSGIIDRKKR